MGEFLTHTVDQTDRAGLAGADAGAVLHDAVFHQHQRQPPVDQQLRRDGLGDIADLRQRQLKRQKLRIKPLLAQVPHGAGIDDIEAEIAADGEARRAGNVQLSEISGPAPPPPPS